ncbi:MAG: ABC transporter ATP-binding protein [Dehalococcoidia bacterium]|nr:ABC transporter ATP-binding protein [Dehalococcoidia bacterium]
MQTANAHNGPEPTIRVDNVSKWFGNVVAVNEVSLEIGPGITGLLGPNGAGKTTLLHMMTGLSATSRGTITVLGQPARGDTQLYRQIGVMTEHQAVYDFYTGREFVEFSARMHKLDDIPDAVQKAIESVNMTDAQDRRLSTYSRGMRQRMRLAATLVHDPPVLVLDEPLNGTDPRQRLEFHDLARRLAAEGRTIIVSSHILEEVETLADNIVLMVSGKLAASGDFRSIRELLDDRPYRIRVTSTNQRALAGGLIGNEAVTSVTIEDDGSILLLTHDLPALQIQIATVARDTGAILQTVEPQDESLESVFTYIVER